MYNTNFYRDDDLTERDIDVVLTNFSPDGLTEQDVDVLIAEAYESADQAPISTLLEGTAARRRTRRIERRTVNGAVRVLMVRRTACAGPDGQEAA